MGVVHTFSASLLTSKFWREESAIHIGFNTVSHTCIHTFPLVPFTSSCPLANVCLRAELSAAEQHMCTHTCEHAE